MDLKKINREEIFKYVKDKFSTLPEYLWQKFPDYAVLRHNHNSKWYGIVMNVPKHKIGIEGNEKIDILDIKCDFLMIGSLLQKKGFFPAYHMNKEHWITIILDGSVSKEETFNLLDLSFNLTKKQKN